MMKSDENIHLKFPCILRTKLESKELEFPDGIEFDYKPIWAYRCIEREQDDNTSVSRSDFLSNIEALKQKGKTIKKRRGQVMAPEEDINYYGTSLFKDRRIIENAMRLPRPSKKICCGFVFMEGGPQVTDDQHINWWIYEYVNDFSGFKIEEGGRNSE